MSTNTQPTYKRQRFLLAFIRQLGSGVSATDLQKLVFLHTMNEGGEFYEFLPYKFGSYSFQLAEDVDILGRNGYLTVEGTKVKATGVYSQDNLFAIDTERGNNLIRKAYRAYPYYTINSEMIDRLYFNTEETARFNGERQKYSQTEQSLFTIGYEGKSIEAFINALIQNGVKLLCDVRKNPLSRKFGFSKSKLQHITGMVGIQYIHIPNLGIESDKRSTLETAEDYEVLFDDYSNTLPTLEPYLDWVYSLLRANIRIALMCYEKDAAMCHRHVIRDYISNAHRVSCEDISDDF
jgi:uncharacterized protein (DUF488 family)